MRIVPLLAGLAMLFGASAAQAGVSSAPIKSFRFDGAACTEDCIDGASAFLSVQESEIVPVNGGTTLNDFNVVFFDFESDSIFFNNFNLAGISSASGTLFGTPDEVANIVIEGTAFVDPVVDQEVAIGGGQELISFIFRTFADDEDGGFNMFRQDIQTSDIGSIGVWNPVPEPGVLALFGAGLIGLGLARRRRRVAA